jgi:hypothetical protein
MRNVWATNASTPTPPRSSRPRLRPFHNNPVKQPAETAPSPADTMSEVRRSAGVCALSGVVPSRLSTGVRSQNKASAVTVKRISGHPRCVDATPTVAPVNRGTSSKPQAPCSRGTTRARMRGCWKERALKDVSVVACDPMPSAYYHRRSMLPDGRQAGSNWVTSALPVIRPQYLVSPRATCNCL